MILVLPLMNVRVLTNRSASFRHRRQWDSLTTDWGLRRIRRGDREAANE